MANKQIRKFNPILLVIMVVVVALGLFLYIQNSQSSTVSYASKDLKISLNYPKPWYIQEKDLDIMISSYNTRIGENSRPNSNQIKIFVDKFNAGCHPAIEENLKDPACGEGGPQVKPNEITSKEVKQVRGGTFFKYIVESPNGDKFTFYLLENNKRVLNISKKPDPSKFEEEFEEIVDSIRFK